VLKLPALDNRTQFASGAPKNFNIQALLFSLYFHPVWLLII
jgi:hypothetical protein